MRTETPSSYDAWRTAEPESDPFSCVVCGDSGFDQSVDAAPYLTDDGAIVCSWACHAVDAARHAVGVEATMRAIIRACDEGADGLRVHARTEGGNHNIRGEVIDWSHDGERIVVRSEALGRRELTLHRSRLRALAVL